MEIKKRKGKLEKFDQNKLCKSVENAGASKALAFDICNFIKKDIKPGFTTNKIFRQAFKYLAKEDIEIAARYGLERAIDFLGPAGFIFEQYVEAILQSLEYKTRRNIFIAGECIEHEIDVQADKGNFRYLIEAKYRNGHKIKTHVDQVMYADSRLQDIKRAAEKRKENKEYFMWVITNTNFTNKAIEYSKCRDLKLLGWNYPKNDNLRTLTHRKKLYPVSVLPSITKEALLNFVSKKIILVQDLLFYSEEELSKKFGIKKTLAKKLAKEVKDLIKY